MQCERVTVILLQLGMLFILTQNAISDRQDVDARAHEAAVGVLGRADDGLAPDVEAGVDEDAW